MAIPGTQARIIVDKWDVSCETSSLVMANAISEEDCTTLCSTASEYTPILPSMTISQDGYMHVAGELGNLEHVLYVRMGVEGSMICALFGTADAGCPAYVLDNSFGSSMEIGAPATSIITVNGAWGQGMGGNRGYRIYDGDIAATGPQSSVDFGVAGTLGGEAFLFLRNVTGSLGTATIGLTSSTTEAGTYSTFATASLDDMGAVRVAWSGANNRWIRANVTSLGGATNLDLVIVVCVNGVTQ